MQVQSEVLRTIPAGSVLQISLDEHTVWAYVVLSEPDLERVAEFVPPEQFEISDDVHVMAITLPEDAADLVQEVLFNMNPRDTVVFLCHDLACRQAVLDEFGQHTDHYND